MRICKTLGEDLQGFMGLWERIMRLWERIREDSWGFVRIHKLWERIHEDLQDFGRGFVRICETLGEDLQGFMVIHEDSQGFVRLWERICNDL